MENLTTKMIITGIVFLLMLITGFVLTRTGYPYNKAIVTFHKLLSLTTIGLLLWLAIPFLKEAGWNVLMWVSLVTALLFVLLIASGAVLSGEKEMPKGVTIIHRISSMLVILSTIILVWIIVTK